MLTSTQGASAGDRHRRTSGFDGGTVIYNVTFRMCSGTHLHGGHDELPREGVGVALEKDWVPALPEEDLKGLRFRRFAEVQQRLRGAAITLGNTSARADESPRRKASITTRGTCARNTITKAHVRRASVRGPCHTAKDNTNCFSLLTPYANCAQHNLWCHT